MDLERGVLARLDRKLLAGLGQDERFQMVRVPVTAAKWSTWKRSCDWAGVSMGRAIAALIDRELVSVFGCQTDDRLPVFAEEAEEELAARQVSRNERCPCGSGLKYKHCHGLPGRNRPILPDNVELAPAGYERKAVSDNAPGRECHGRVPFELVPLAQQGTCASGGLIAAARARNGGEW